MKARVLALLALTATVAMVVTAVALAAFGAPETADPERRTGENDAIPPGRQLAAAANGKALWLSTTSAATPGGRVAVYRRCGGAQWPLERRLGGTDADAAGIAMNPQGDALIVYYEDDAGDRTLLSVTRAADGTYGSPEMIATGGDLSIPTFALAANGTAVAAWGSGGKVQMAFRPAGGPWGAVHTTAESGATRIHTAIDADGDAVVIAHAFPQERGYFRPSATGTWTAAENVEDIPGAPEGSEVEFTGDGRPVALISAQGRLFASIRGAGGWPATPTELDSTNSNLVVPLARHGSGIVAAWLRRAGSAGTPLRLAVSRLDGAAWETRKEYVGDFTGATVSANAAGAILLAGGSGDEIWGTTVGSISAGWPATLDRLSPVKDAQHLYRAPTSAAGGDAFLLGYALHHPVVQRSDVVATAPASPCADGGTPTPPPTSTATATPSATASLSPQPVPPAPIPARSVRPKLAELVSMPSAKRCVRKLKVRVKKRSAIARIKLRVNGKGAKVKRRGRTIALRRVPKKRFKLEVRVTLKDGRLVKGSRRYRPCR
jgi:hypothetical protein